MTVKTEFVIDEQGHRKAIMTVTRTQPVMRPTYETETDITHEAKLCEYIELASTFKAKKVKKKLYPFDIVLLHEKNIVAFIEFKHRPGALNYLDGVILSLEKLSCLCSLGTASQKPVFFVIDHGDQDYFSARIEAKDYKVQIGGRTDRHDESDIEPVAMIPRKDFYSLSRNLQEIRDLIEKKRVLT